MKLRHRLFLFSTVQLVVFGALFAIAFGTFEQRAIPMFEGLLRAKSERVARLASAELDVALGADDPKLIAAAVHNIEEDADFQYVAVRDAHDTVVFSRGTWPDRDTFAGAPYVAVDGASEIGAWSPVSLEGMRLGSVAVVFSTSRLDELDAWAKRLLVLVSVLWLGALAYSIFFARSFVSPIRAMMDFSRKVAGRELSERLEVDCPGELGELRDYLNQMTAELEQREAERKVAAAKVEEMQRDLLAVSRMAGMAEVATGVLHNVGNVLNSLNLSVSIIDDEVRNSRIGALTSSIEVADGFPGGLPAFLGTDRGKAMPRYLALVSKRLVAENAKVVAEIAAVSRNVDHIKSIVAMQQTYARPSGMTERIAVADLIDDALRMGESSFAKHGIEVVKDYGPGAIVVADRHKLLQILINVISNARHALKEGQHAAQRITATIRQSATTVTIAISDNGVGVPAENLDRVFGHGFTTKRGGHGFGLHASANAAKELGGSLSLTSDGAGLGTTLTLELPASSRSDHATGN